MQPPEQASAVDGRVDDALTRRIEELERVFTAQEIEARNQEVRVANQVADLAAKVDSVSARVDTANGQIAHLLDLIGQLKNALLLPRSNGSHG